MSCKSKNWAANLAAQQFYSIKYDPQLSTKNSLFSGNSVFCTNKGSQFYESFHLENRRRLCYFIITKGIPTNR